MTLRQAGGCLALTVALVCAAAAQSGVQGDKQFQAALHKEMVDGDLKAAIEAYRTISTRPGVGRELAATALVRMADCYQKLGDAQARQIYAQVVREFADQPIATKEVWHLTLTGPARKLDIDGRQWGEGFEVHPDGRQIAFAAQVGEPGGEVLALENFLPSHAAKR